MIKKCLIFPLIFFLSLMPAWIGWSAEDTSPPSDQTTSPRFVVPYPQPRETTRQSEPTTYPLFRSHDPKYYPPKSARTAILLSATLPGLGQTYAGNTSKGFLFLVTELGVLSFAGFHLDRAVYYNDMADRFATGFYDQHTNTFLSPDEGNVQARSHAIVGAIFLAAGIGVHIWNIFDAADTTAQYNKRRFPVQVQQTNNGRTYLAFSHHF